jgi:hypothetical protein
MKINQTNIIRPGAILLTGLFTAGVAIAATTSNKDGMETTTTVMPAEREYTGDGLPMLAAGVQELSLGGNVNWEESTAYSFDISYGRFLTQNWMVGASAGLTGINSDKDYRIGVFAEYNFLTGTKWVPFVRAGVGYAHPDEGGSSGTVGLDGGVKYFMRPNLAIYGSVGGDWVISGSGSSNGFAKQLNLGLKFYF